MVISKMAITRTRSLRLTCPPAELRISPMAGARTLVQVGVRKISPIVCTGEQTASGGGQNDPPKLEPFSQSRLSRSMRERNFLQKAEDAINDKCMALEGDAAYQCWEALFDYENIKEEAESECSIAEPDNRDDACRRLERFENMVRQSGGVNSLIDNVRMVARINEAKMQKKAPDEEEWLKAVSAAGEEKKVPSELHEFLEDGGIPKTLKEMQEEIDALLPDSPFTRVLKRRGHHDD